MKKTDNIIQYFSDTLKFEIEKYNIKRIYFEGDKCLFISDEIKKDTVKKINDVVKNWIFEREQRKNKIDNYISQLEECEQINGKKFVNKNFIQGYYNGLWISTSDKFWWLNSLRGNSIKECRKQFNISFND